MVNINSNYNYLFNNINPENNYINPENKNTNNTYIDKDIVKDENEKHLYNGNWNGIISNTSKEYYSNGIKRITLNKIQEDEIYDNINDMIKNNYMYKSTFISKPYKNLYKGDMKVYYYCFNNRKINIDENYKYSLLYKNRHTYDSNNTDTNCTFNIDDNKIYGIDYYKYNYYVDFKTIYEYEQKCIKFRDKLINYLKLHNLNNVFKVVSKCKINYINLLYNPYIDKNMSNYDFDLWIKLEII